VRRISGAQAFVGAAVGEHFVEVVPAVAVRAAGPAQRLASPPRRSV
jgi:hypothetical protein